MKETPENPRETILLVDDEASYRLLLKSVLGEAGFEVIDAGDGQAALAILARRTVDLAVLDLMMPKMDGRTLMKKIHERDAELPIVFLTAHGSIPSAVEAIREGASDYLTKPLPHIDDLVRTVRRILENRQLRNANRQLAAAIQDPEPFPAIDPVMLALLEKARKIAAADVSVLITGESGTGKERLARFLHQHSLRQGRAMVALNCAAIPEHLLESELFGHEKGSFTGASERRTGRFEEAHQSTLFLDEIGEMPLPLQPKILRALQERELRRVGGDRVIRFDARLIAATNRDLKTEAHAGRFREDLYYRLSVVKLHIPALRERPADIGFLAQRLVKDVAARFGKVPPVLDAAALALLQKHSWPGNVRELSNVIEASVLLADGLRMGPADIHGLETGRPGGGIHSDRLSSSESAPLDTFRHDSAPATEGSSPLVAAERRTIETALSRFHGNRRQTAEFLGMTTRNLLYKLKKLGLGKAGEGPGGETGD